MKSTTRSRALAILATLSSLLAMGSQDVLLEGFRTPPKEAKPHVWWHWMNGNVSKEGITADLEAMASAGIGGAQIFDVSDGIPAGRVAFNTDLWFEMLKHANAEAKRLGIELCLANCSGWSSSGGPWVKPENSEKEIVFAETLVKGGSTYCGNLPRAAGKEGFYRDLAVVAFPRPKGERIRLEDYVDMSRNPPKVGDATAEVVFMKPFPLSGVALTLQGGGRHTQSKVTVDVDCGEGWKTAVRDFVVYPTRYGFSDERIFVPVVAENVRRLKVVCVSSKGTRLVAARPEARARIVEESAKTLAIRSRIVGHANTVRAEACVDAARIQILTTSLGADGRFEWTAPADAEEWVVVRFGYSSNGTRNRPPTPAGDGLEVDKFSKAALGRFFAEGYVGRALKELGPVDPRGGFNALIVDSFEVKSQNWTEGFEKIFSARKGYDLLPWLPVFTGRVVGSVQRTDDVLSDFRTVAGALFVENYAAEFHRLCKAQGLTFYLEGYGSSPSDDLVYARHCDVPMGEFWAGKRSPSHPKADVGGIMNCAWPGFISHVWGQRYAAAESFTSDESSRWDRDPFAYKAQGDRVFCAGVNRIIYHRWAHQPWTNPANYPGMTMGPHGSHFERTQTWWKDAAPVWLAYQARCQYLLQQGTTAADLLVVAPSQTPSCGLDLGRWHDYGSVKHDLFGRGVQWDLCGEDALAVSKPMDGKIVVPSGAVYSQSLKLGAKAPRIEPDFDCADNDLYKDLRWIHRRTPAGDELYFVALPNATSRVFEVSFRQQGRTPEIWEPEDGSCHQPESWREVAGRTFVTLVFKPSGSAFVLFRKQPTEGLKPAPAFVKEDRARPVEGPWQVTFNEGRGAPAEAQTFAELMPWNEHPESGIRFYSGSATYEKTLEIPSSGFERIVLDLGDVKNVAVVTVNGTTYPCLWRPPYRVDITDALREKRSATLSIRVTNQWPNRLIGDEALPCDAQYRDRQGAHERDKKDGIVAIPERLWKGEASPNGRHTFTTWRLWKKTDRLLPSGLIGPVRLLRQ